MALRVPLFRTDPPPGGKGGAATTARPNRAARPTPRSVAKPAAKSAAKSASRSPAKGAPASGAARRPAPAETEPPKRRTLTGWWQRTGGGGSAEPAQPAASGKATGSSRRDVPAAEPSAGPAAAQPGRRGRLSRPRTDEPAASRRTPAPPPAPLLQRRSIGALAARGLVLALLVVAMVAFAVALARVTLVPSPSSDALVHTNLRPGASIRAYLDQPETRDTIKQIGGNILLGVPFGILLPALFPRTRGLLRVVLATALVMLLVETAQGAIVEGRAFDIDDVILNTAGSLLGYLVLGRRLGRALHPRRTHWYHRYGYGTAPKNAPTKPLR
jgi:hypothetical protein